MQNKKIGFNIFEVIAIIVISSVVSIIATGIITTNNNTTSSGTNYSEVLKDENIKSFLDTYESVTSNFYGDVDKSKVIDSAINGMMEYFGDKYSTYLDDSSTDALNNMLSGTYKGIGISITADRVIYDVFADSPAERVGIMEDDIIIEANGINVENKTSSEIVDIFNQNPDNIVLKVKRGEEFKTFELKMEEVPNPAVSSAIFDYEDKKVGYMYINAFSKNVSNQVSKTLSKLERVGINGLLIDLRRNNGGYLVAAEETSSIFIEKGKTLYSLETKESKVSVLDETDEKREYPIVVIVDEETASAAEILTAALKDSYGAKVVGRQTYGKGLVQQTKGLNDGSMVKYSTARWLTPNGEWINDVGITPDYVIEEDTTVENKVTENIYVDKAIEVLFK